VDIQTLGQLVLRVKWFLACGRDPTRGGAAFGGGVVGMVIGSVSSGWRPVRLGSIPAVRGGQARMTPQGGLGTFGGGRSRERSRRTPTSTLRQASLAESMEQMFCIALLLVGSGPSPLRDGETGLDPQHLCRLSHRILNLS
jgi:hypothetical protein